MRILLVSANFRPAVGGIEGFTEALASGLTGAGHHVSVLCCRKDGAPLRETADGVPIDRVRSTYLLQRVAHVPYPIPEPRSLVSAVRRTSNGIDIVHVQDALYVTSVAALAAARRRRIPSVLTQHVAFVPQGNRLLDGAQRAAIRTLGRSARLATAVTTVNPAVADWVERTWRVPARHLPIGVRACAAANGDRAAVRESFGLPTDRFLALFVGRNVPKKGIDHFLDGHGDGYDLVAVTDRPVTSDTRARFFPFMEHGRLQQLLSVVDAFVLPSVGEGFPLVIPEALSVGVPVVTTAGPGYDRYLRPDEAVFVERDGASIRNALERLSSDAALHAELSQRALAVAAREFRIEAFVGRYEALYAELVEQAGSRR